MADKPLIRHCNALGQWQTDIPETSKVANPVPDGCLLEIAHRSFVAPPAERGTFSPTSGENEADRPDEGAVQR